MRDRIVQHALFEGYSQRLVKGQFPIAALFIKVPFEEVDVNVHPTKNEVRFARQNDVHEAVRQAVAQTLFEADKSSWGAPKAFKAEEFARQDRVSETGVKEFGMQERRTSESKWRKSEFGDRNDGIQKSKPEVNSESELGIQ